MIKRKQIDKRNRPKKYLELLEIIHRRVDQGIYDSQIPVRELAGSFKVNIKTVNRAVDILVERGVLTRFHGYGTYVAGNEPANIGIKTRKINSRKYAFIVNKIILFLPHLQILAACDKELSRIGGSVIFTHYDEEEVEDFEGFLGRLRAQRVEGVFITGLIGEEYIRRLQQEFSLVLIDTGTKLEAVNAVVWDYYGMGYGLAVGLIEQGCRSFSLMEFSDEGDFSLENNNQRFLGMQAAIKAAGLKYTQHFIPWDMSSLTPDCDLARELQASKGANHALIMVNFPSIFPVLRKTDCLALLPDLSIGSIISATKIDAEQLNTAPCGVYATLDLERLGEVAANMITDILGRPKKSFRKEIIPTEIKAITNY